MKRNPERENFAMQPISSRLAHLIHIRVTFDSITGYIKFLLDYVNGLSQFPTWHLKGSQFSWGSNFFSTFSTF